MSTTKPRRTARKRWMKLSLCTSIIAGCEFAFEREPELNRGRPPIFRLIDGREPYLAMQLDDLDLPNLEPPEDPLPIEAEQISLLTLMKLLAAEARPDNGVPLLFLRQHLSDGLLIAFDRQDWPYVLKHRAMIRSMALSSHAREHLRDDFPAGERGVRSLILI